MAIDPITMGALVTGGANLVGSIAGNYASAKQARLQRGWEEKMSNTAWQRGTADMRAAGINPMLAFMEGPASTPAGAVGQVPNPNVLGEAASAYMGTRIQGQQFRIARAQAREADAKASIADAEFQFRFGDPRNAGYREAANWEVEQAVRRASAASALANAALSAAAVPGAKWTSAHPVISRLLTGAAGAASSAFGAAVGARTKGPRAPTAARQLPSTWRER